MQPAVFTQVEFDEGTAGAGDLGSQFVGVRGTPGAGTPHLLRIGVEREQRFAGGVAHLDVDTCRAPREAHRYLARLLSGLARQAPEDHDLLEARPSRERGQTSGNLHHPLQGLVDHRPHVEKDPAAIEPVTPLRLVPANAVDARSERALDGGEREHRTLRIAQRRGIAHLRQGHESLVGRVVLGRQEEEVGVIDGREPGAVEVLQPPQVKALAGQRMHVSDDALLDEPVSRRAECQLPRPPAAVVEDGDRDPPALADCGDIPQHREQGCGHLVRVVGRPLPGDIEICDEIRRIAHVVREHRDLPRHVSKTVDVGDRCDEMQAYAPQVETPGDELPVCAQEGRHVLKGPDLVVAPREGFQQRLMTVAVGDHPGPEQVHDRLGQGGDRVEVLRPVRGLRVLSKVVQVLLDALIGLLTGTPDRRLLEELVPNRPREVAESGVADLRHLDQLVEHLSDRASALLGHLASIGQPMLQHGPHDRDMVCSPLLREEESVDSLLQLLGAFEVIDPVVPQRSGEATAEALRKALLLHIKRFQVRVEMLLGAVYPLVVRAFVIGRPIAIEVAQVGECPE